MKQIPVSLSELYNRRLPLGRVGENIHVQIVFQCNAIFADYPNATTKLIVTAPGGESYAPEIEKSGTNILWTVTDSDLAEEGGGEVQLTFKNGNEKIKSYIGKTQIFRSLAENGQIPTPVENWMKRADNKLSEIDEAIEELSDIDATVTGLSAGANPTVTVTDVDGHKRLNFGIPKGDKGDPGDLQLDATLQSSTAAAPADQVGELKSAISEIGNPPKILDSTKTGVDLDFSDVSGNVIVRLKDGHIQTKEFDSSEIVDEETLSTAINGVEDQIEQIGAEEISPNIFNPDEYDDSEYLDSSFLLNNGNVSTSSSYSSWLVTPKILIDPSTQYTLTPKVWNRATGKNRIRAYSSDDTPLAELTVTENADGSATFTSPETASYFRMSYYKNQVSFANSIKNFKESFMLVKGATAPESYVPYFEPYFRLDGKIGPSGMIEPDYMLPLWYGKKMVNFGDSIFGNIRPPKDMSAKIAQYTGAKTYNCAFGGCRMGIHSGHWDAFSMYRLAYAIAHNDFSVQDDAIQYDDRTSYAEVPLATLKAVDFSTVDMITIAYGTNDFGGGNEDIDNSNNPMDTTTLAGALRYSLDQIMTAFPKIRIAVLGIIYRHFSGTSSDTYVNARGNTIAEYNAKLKEVSEQYHVRFIDNANIGFNTYTINTYYLDGTHPNEDGLDVYARHFANEIN